MTKTGKTALVTGSTSGIGKAIAERLAADGANIVLNGFGDPEAIERQRLELASTHGVEVIFDGADLSQQSAADAMMDHVLDRLGAIDILVNNAGVQFVSPIDEFPVEKWNTILAINLSASFHLTRRAIPAMKAKSWGASSTSPRLTRWSRRHTRPPMSRRSTRSLA